MRRHEREKLNTRPTHLEDIRERYSGQAWRQPNVAKSLPVSRMRGDGGIRDANYPLAAPEPPARDVTHPCPHSTLRPTLATTDPSWLQFRKMISDISESLAELEADVDAMQCDATAGSLCSKVTHGWMTTAEMSSLSSPRSEVPGVFSARQGEILAHYRHQHHTTSVADSAGGCNPGASENGALARLRHKMAVFRNVIRYVGLANEEACK